MSFDQRTIHGDLCRGGLELQERLFGSLVSGDKRWISGAGVALFNVSLLMCVSLPDQRGSSGTPPGLCSVNITAI